MGLIQRFLGVSDATQGIGGAVETVAEVFAINKTKAELAKRAQAMASLRQYGEEFENANTGAFNSFINGINRLPRPIVALGTVGLFVFAMANPENFATRMQGLAYIPDLLWWLWGLSCRSILARESYIMPEIYDHQLFCRSRTPQTMILIHQRLHLFRSRLLMTTLR